MGSKTNSNLVQIVQRIRFKYLELGRLGAGRKVDLEAPPPPSVTRLQRLIQPSKQLTGGKRTLFSRVWESIREVSFKIIIWPTKPPGPGVQVVNYVSSLVAIQRLPPPRVDWASALRRTDSKHSKCHKCSAWNPTEGGGDAGRWSSRLVETPSLPSQRGLGRKCLRG